MLVPLSSGAQVPASRRDLRCGVQLGGIRNAAAVPAARGSEQRQAPRPAPSLPSSASEGQMSQCCWQCDTPEPQPHPPCPRLWPHGCRSTGKGRSQARCAPRALPQAKLPLHAGLASRGWQQQRWHRCAHRAELPEGCWQYQGSLSCSKGSPGQVGGQPQPAQGSRAALHGSALAALCLQSACCHVPVRPFPVSASQARGHKLVRTHDAASGIFIHPNCRHSLFFQEPRLHMYRGSPQSAEAEGERAGLPKGFSSYLEPSLIFRHSPAEAQAVSLNREQHLLHGRKENEFIQPMPIASWPAKPEDSCLTS